MAALKLTRGDTPTIRVGPVVRNNVLVDLNGASAVMTVRQTLTGTVVFQVTATFDTVNGYILIKPAASDTELLTPGKYVYDVELTEQDGTITTFPAKGSEQLILQADVTHV